MGSEDSSWMEKTTWPEKCNNVWSLSRGNWGDKYPGLTLLHYFTYWSLPSQNHWKVTPWQFSGKDTLLLLLGAQVPSCWGADTTCWVAQPQAKQKTLRARGQGSLLMPSHTDQSLRAQGRVERDGEWIWNIKQVCNISHAIVSSVQLLRRVPMNSLWPHESQHTRPPCPSPAPRVYSNSCPSSRWCHPAISPSVIPFSSCPQSLPASGSFPMSQLFAWGDQSIAVSASTSVLPMNTQDWSPLGWTGWISLQSKGLSRVFSNTTV